MPDTLTVTDVERLEWYLYTGNDEPYITAGTMGEGAYDVRAPMMGGPVQIRPVTMADTEWSDAGVTVESFTRDLTMNAIPDGDGYEHIPYLPNGIRADTAASFGLLDPRDRWQRDGI